MILCYENTASKISLNIIILFPDARSYRSGSSEVSVWNNADGFYFDSISGVGKYLVDSSLIGGRFTNILYCDFFKVECSERLKRPHASQKCCFRAPEPTYEPPDTR